MIHLPIALSLAAIGLSAASSWFAIRWMRVARQLDARTDELATELATCTTDRTRARLEADALRTVLLTVGVQVTLTWQDDRIAQAIIADSPAKAALIAAMVEARPHVGQPWKN